MPNTRRLLLSLWLPLSLMLAGYLLANHFANQQQQQKQQRINQAVAKRLAQITEGVRDKVTLYQYGLRATRGAVMAVSPDNFNYQHMQTYSKSRNFKLEFPGARGFGLIKRVNPEDTTAFLAQMALERPDYSFNIRQLNSHDDSLFIIQYIEPEQQNRQAVGLDIGSEAMRRHAAINAALYDEVRLTAPITLVQAHKQSQQGFLILMPVYQSLPVPQDPNRRLELLFGWSYAPILINEVLSAVSGLQQDVQLNISDITNSTSLTFFSHGDAEVRMESYKHQQTIDLFGRQWQLTLTPTPAFISALDLPNSNTLYWQIISLTALVAILIYLLHLLYMHRHQQKKHQAELAQIAEMTLLQANTELEQQIAARTAEIFRVNTLQRSILSGAGYAIIATDTDGTITAFNPAAERLLGYKASEVIQQHTPAIFHLPAEVERHAAKLTAELGYQVEVGFDTFVAKARTGISDANRWTYITKDDAQVQVKLNVSALLDEQGELTGYLGIAFDLTEQLEREAELAQAKQVAESASKAKSAFLANMSHEIRTPMNAILGLLQLMANTALDKRQHDYIERTQRAANSLLALLNDILDFSKVEAGKLELDPHQFSLATLMQDIGIILSSSTEQKELEVLFHIAPDVPKQLIGDSLRIKQVLLNLAGNAIKFTEQGEVLISVTARPQQDRQLKLHFSIRDTGIGMTAAQQHTLFSGFHQAESSISRRFGGTGLGLAISKRLVNLMGGTISVQSQPGKGSTFSFDILLQQAESQTIASPASVARLANNLKVLIVDDNDNARLILQEMATSFGWQADTAEDAQHAMILLQHAVNANAAYTLLFLDWHMPGMDGLEFAKILKQQSDHTTPLVVMITAYSRDMLHKHADSYQQLLDGFLIKPVTHDMMLNAVQAILAPDIASPEPATDTSTPLEGIALLLVEDNQTNQLVATELLQAQGAIIDIASSGAEALTLLQQHGHRYDLILMDIQMPQMDGYETTRRIRQQSQFDSLPIVAMTANALQTDKAACLAVGMQDHIAKPFELNEVIHKVLHYCKQNKPAATLGATQAIFSPAVLSYCQQHNICLERASSRLGHSLPLYMKVLQQFRHDLQQAVQHLQQSPLKVSSSKILFHSIKGAASTVGFTRIAALAATEETALNKSSDNDFTCQNTVLAELEAAIPLITSLSEMLSAAQPHQEKPGANQGYDLQQQFNELMANLTGSNMAALPLFQQLEQALRSIDAEQAKQLNQAISNLAFEHAAAILQKMLSERVH